MVNIEETAVPLSGSVLPKHGIAVSRASAVNGVHGDAAFQSAGNHGGIGYIALVEGFVARNEDQLQGIGILRIPFQFLQGPVHHGATVFFTASGLQLEQFIGHLVQIVRKGEHLANPRIFGGQPAAPVLVQGDLDGGQFAVLARQRHVVDNLPQIRAGLIDQPLHAAGSVQKKGYLNHGAVILFRGGLARGLSIVFRLRGWPDLFSGSATAEWDSLPVVSSSPFF